MAEEKKPIKLCRHVEKLAKMLNNSPLELHGIDDYDLCSAQIMVECHECDVYVDLNEILQIYWPKGKKET